MQPLTGHSPHSRQGRLLPTLLAAALSLLLLQLAAALPFTASPPQGRTPAPGGAPLRQDVAAIAPGFHAGCAITISGALQCWRGEDAPVTVDLNGIAGKPQQVVAGADFACALLASQSAPSTVVCLDLAPGPGGLAHRLEPILTGDIAALSAGLSHACAVVSGEARCWGSNWYGELGAGVEGVASDAPLSPSLAGPVQKVVAGYRHTCALLQEGAVQCWGHSSAGQLGTGDNHVSRLQPRIVPGLAAGVADLAAGGEHTCALLVDGRVQCWGANWWGQLGDGSATARSLPVFAQISGVRAIVAGGGHTCALAASDELFCWGDNAAGQLGDAGGREELLPRRVRDAPPGISALSAGAAQTCALLHSGEARCWGLALP